MNAAAVGISMCFIALPTEPELPLAPELPFIAFELPAIASELAVGPARAITDPQLRDAAALPEARSTALSTMNRRAGQRRSVRGRGPAALPLAERCVRRFRPRRRSCIASRE
jgi:hypothetical protein